MKKKLAYATLAFSLLAGLFSFAFGSCGSEMAEGVSECNARYPRYIEGANDAARAECLWTVRVIYDACVEAR